LHAEEPQPPTHVVEISLLFCPAFSDLHSTKCLCSPTRICYLPLLTEISIEPSIVPPPFLLKSTFFFHYFPAGPLTCQSLIVDVCRSALFHPVHTRCLPSLFPRPCFFFWIVSRAAVSTVIPTGQPKFFSLLLLRLFLSLNEDVATWYPCPGEAPIIFLLLPSIFWGLIFGCP